MSHSSGVNFFAGPSERRMIGVPGRITRPLPTFPSPGQNPHYVEGEPNIGKPRVFVAVKKNHMEITAYMCIGGMDGLGWDG